MRKNREGKRYDINLFLNIKNGLFVFAKQILSCCIIFLFVLQTIPVRSSEISISCIAPKTIFERENDELPQI